MRLASETISCPTEGEEMTGQDPKKNDLDTRAFRDDAGGAVGRASRLSEAHRSHSRGRLCYIPVYCMLYAVYYLLASLRRAVGGVFEVAVALIAYVDIAF